MGQKVVQIERYRGSIENGCDMHLGHFGQENVDGGNYFCCKFGFLCSMFVHEGGYFAYSL